MSTATTPKAVSRGDKQRLFAALDLLQEQRAETEQKNSSLMSAKEAEEDLLTRLRDLQVASGLPVNEDELRAAVRATREPTGIRYEVPDDGLARSLSSIYIQRARWLPATTIGLCLVVAGWVSVETTQYVSQKNFEGGVAAAQSTSSQLERDLEAAEAAVLAWPSGRGQDVYKAEFADAVASAGALIGQSKPLLASPTRETLPVIESRQDSARKTLESAKAHQSSSRQQADVVRAASQWLAFKPDGSWPEASQRIASRQSQLGVALDAGDIHRARGEIQAISALSGASATRATIREAAALVPAAGQTDAQALRNRGEAALLAGDMTAATAAISDIRALTDVLGLAYELRIVNENGVDTGFWRRPNNNPSAYNYYVVVDAIDASGNPVRVPVVNEENGKRETVSRFAVRVSETEFEGVKRDKMDNGLIDNPVVGTKRAGEVRTDYHMDAGAGIITNW